MVFVKSLGLQLAWIFLAACCVAVVRVIATPIPVRVDRVPITTAAPGSEILLDVRSTADFERGHPAGAISLPPPFGSSLSRLDPPLSTDLPIAVRGYGPNDPGAEFAADKLRQLGFTQVRVAEAQPDRGGGYAGH